MADQVVGRVQELARYPVKSTAGQSLASADVDARGLVHDREWAAYTSDGGMASGKTSRRFRKVDGLLHWRSSVEARPELHSPDGQTYAVEDPAASRALSTAFGRELVLRREAGQPHHDDCGVHLVTTASLRRVAELVGAPVEAGRARANLVLDTDGTGFLEDDWTGAELAVGDEVRLRVLGGMPRCVMVDLPQVGVRAQPHVLQALGRSHATLLGLQAEVVRPGVVSVGDLARLHLA